MARRHCARWNLADHEAEVSRSLKQFTVTHRVGAINAVRHDRDRIATRCQRRSMGGTFDAVRAAGHDKPFSVGEVGSKLPGHMLAVGCRGPCAGDRDEIAERPRKERCRAASPEDVRSPRSSSAEGHSLSPGISVPIPARSAATMFCSSVRVSERWNWERHT